MLLLACLPLLRAVATSHDVRAGGDQCALSPPPPDQGLQVHVDRTVTLFPPALSLASAPSAFAFRNGDIQAIVRFGANESHGARSSNGGRTWRAAPQQPPPFPNRTQSEIRTYACQLADGEVVLFSGFNNQSRDSCCGGSPCCNGQDFKRARDGAIPTELLRSRDNGLTQISSVAKLWLPAGLDLTNMQHAPIVELKNGSLMAVTYGSWLSGWTVQTSCLKDVPVCKTPWTTAPCSSDADCHTFDGKGVTCGGSQCCRSPCVAVISAYNAEKSLYRWPGSGLPQHDSHVLQPKLPRRLVYQKHVGAFERAR